MPETVKLNPGAGDSKVNLGAGDSKVNPGPSVHAY